MAFIFKHRLSNVFLRFPSLPVNVNWVTRRNPWGQLWHSALCVGQTCGNMCLNQGVVIYLCICFFNLRLLVLFVLVLWMRRWHCICKFSSMPAHVLWALLYNNRLKREVTSLVLLNFGFLSVGAFFRRLNSIIHILKDLRWQFFSSSQWKSLVYILIISSFQSLFLLQMLIGSSIYVQRGLWEFFSDVIGVQRFAMGLFTGHGTGKALKKPGGKKKCFLMCWFFFFISNLKMSSRWQNEGIDRSNSKLEIMRDVFQRTLSPLYNRIQ